MTFSIKVKSLDGSTFVVTDYERSKSGPTDAGVVLLSLRRLTRTLYKKQIKEKR